MSDTAKPTIAIAARSTIAFVLLLLSLTAGGREQTAMRFERVTIDDGLSQSAVHSIAQDQTGFMWFATENGLDRYDGFAFRNYRRERGNPKSLSENFARDLEVAADGSLWVATDGGGISRWMPDTDNFVSWRHDPEDDGSLATDRTRTLLIDPRGFVWIGTRGAGLDRLEVATGKITHFTHAPDDSNTISNNDIFALALAEDGVLWVGTKGGLNRFDPESGQVTRFHSDPDSASSLGDDHVRTLLIDHDGTLWIGSSGGLARFDASTQTFRNFTHDENDHHSISADRVETIFEDAEHRLWVGTNNGLNLMDRENGTFNRYKNDPTSASSISDDDIFSIFQDRGGVLWIGTRTSGLNKWNPRSWSFGHVNPADSDEGGFSNPNVTSFTEDQFGRLWVGTFGGGLNIMDRAGDTITHLRHDPEVSGTLSDDRVMALLTGRDGWIWAGTMTGGLNRIDPTTGAVRTYRHDPGDTASLAANGIMSLTQDRSGTLWIGTFGGGVSRLDQGSEQFVNYRHDPADATSLSSPRATSVVEDNDGVIWAGTDGGGLNRLDRDSGQWEHFVHDPDDPQSLSDNTIYSMHVDTRGTLWIGTRTGLNRLTPEGNVAPAEARFGEISARSRLTSSPVYSIQSELRGNIWLGTARGLTRFNPRSGDVRSFHESQGLQGEEFNFGASYANKSGELFFGGSNGFNAFSPEDLEFNRQPPPVVLTSLSVLNEPVSAGKPYELIDSIDLDYGDDVVTFGISALDYSAPAENRYSYKLEGFDKDWVDAGTERRITYTNLDGGDYIFRVRAANGDGFWNNEGISIPLSIANPPWRTWWAYTFYALVVLGVALAFVRHQDQKLKREAEYSRRLEQEVRQRTDELKRRNVDLKEVNAKLLQASTTDPLTGLRNRRYLFEQITKDVDLVLRHYRDGTETLAPGGNNDLLFLMVDLDNFKPVNDSCGHEAGDELLLQIRDVLLEACRFSDDVVRWGGDEFLIIARDTNREFAATLAERIRSSMSQRVFPIGDGQVARCTASIGYATFPFIAEQPELLQWEEVLGVADAAMYEAKQKRNSWLGIEGIDWDGTGDELYRAIKMNPGKLAEEGLIQAIESVEDVVESVG